MFFQLDPSFEGSKSKICHQDLTLRKIHSLLNHQGYGLMCPVRDTCKWAWRWEEMDNWYCYHYTTLLVDIVMRKYSGEMPNFSPNTNIFHFSTKIDKYTKISTSVIEWNLVPCTYSRQKRNSGCISDQIESWKVVWCNPALTREKLQAIFGWFWYAQKCPVRDRKTVFFLIFFLIFTKRATKAIGYWCKDDLKLRKRHFRLPT